MKLSPKRLKISEIYFLLLTMICAPSMAYENCKNLTGVYSCRKCKSGSNKYANISISEIGKEGEMKISYWNPNYDSVNLDEHNNFKGDREKLKNVTLNFEDIVTKKTPGEKDKYYRTQCMNSKFGNAHVFIGEKKDGKINETIAKNLAKVHSGNFYIRTYHLNGKEIDDPIECIPFGEGTEQGTFYTCPDGNQGINPDDDVDIDGNLNALQEETD